MPSPDFTVTVSLKCVQGSDDFTERNIILKPKQVVHVGRSSKSTNKGLFAAPNNAYFDSPVISREHAVLSVQALTGIPMVYITDTDSMHGTMINDKRLVAGHEYGLKNGDMVQFGTNVVRGDDSFLAKKFRFEANSVVAPQEKSIPLSFSVPDAESSDEDIASHYSYGSSGHVVFDSDPSSDNEDEESVMEVEPPVARRVLRLGSQSNPVNLLDDNTDAATESKTVIEIFEEESAELWKQPEGRVVVEQAINIGQEDRKDDSAKDADRASNEHDADSCNLHAYVEDAGDESDDEAPSHISTSPPPPGGPRLPTLGMAAVSPITAPAPAAQDKPQPQEHPSSCVAVTIDADEGLCSLSSDDDDDDDVDEEEEDDDEIDVSCQMKTMEMLNGARQKQEKENPSYLIDHMRGPSSMIHRELESSAAVPTRSNATPKPTSTTSMSLRNIISNEADSTPATRGKKPQDLSGSEPAGSPMLTPPKEFRFPDATPATLGELYESPWTLRSTMPPRVAAKHFPWGNESSSDTASAGYSHFFSPVQTQWSTPPTIQPSNLFVTNGADGRGYSTERVATPLRFSRSSASVTAFRDYTDYDQPIDDAGTGPGVIPSSSSTLPMYAHRENNLSFASPPPDSLFLRFDSPKLTAGFAPAARNVTPPPMPSDATNKVLEASSAARKAKIGMSIPEIVDIPAQPPTPSSTKSLKRKADEIEDEETIEVQKPANENIITTVPAVAVPSHAQPPKKRTRLGQFASFASGVVVGAVGVFGLLAKLPDSYFE